ncbi:MAG: hypothetical protein KBT20_04285 [Bacteroidales bacterium]|nr:hypothetical protein [Candidatus Liminaster caballi]
MSEGKVYNFYNGSQNVEHIDSQVNNYNYYGSASQEADRSTQAIDALFDKLTKEAIQKKGKEWKEILKPHKAAVDAGAMVQLSLTGFNERFGIDVPKDAFSRWMNGSYNYETHEIGALQARFEALKPQTK